MKASWIGLFLCLLYCWSCSTTKKVNTGEIAYQQKQYAKAIELLTNEISTVAPPEPLYATKAYQLGESYKNIGDIKNSLKWYIQAAKENYGLEAYWEMAYMLRQEERYEDAILTYQRLLKLTQGRENELKKEIEKCKQARRMLTLKGEREYTIEPISANTPQSDYAPALYLDDYLVFTSDRLDPISDNAYLWTGRGYSDIYIHELGTGGIAPFEELNTTANEGSTTFSADGSLLFFTRCDSDDGGDSYCKILMSRHNGSRWESPVEAFYMKPQVNYRDPMLIENDSVLILTSDDPTGIGGQDLYYSILDDDGLWTTPELMPPYLNSIGNERFPTWSADGILYYSSDHFQGLGGLDIFKTELREDGSWTRPQNLMAPINSSKDDMSLLSLKSSNYPDDVHRQLYFASSRSLIGGDDIYLYTEYKTQEERESEKDTTSTEITEEIAEEAPKKNFFLQIKVVEPLYALPDNPNSYVVGKRAVEGASVKFTTPDREDIFITKENGTLLFPIDTGTVYTALAGKRDYLNSRAEYRITTPYSEVPDGQVMELIIKLDRIYEDVDIVMDDIYYDFDQSVIRDDAKPSLNRLVSLMKENPQINIQLSSHTDCQGEESYNQQLSQARAQSAVNYITDVGSIAADRLSAVGYGESQPEIVCDDCDSCTEDDHQVNRRTTFRIVKR